MGLNEFANSSRSFPPLYPLTEYRLETQGVAVGKDQAIPPIVWIFAKSPQRMRRYEDMAEHALGLPERTGKRTGKRPAFSAVTS
jgi:hypothetical protein